MSFRILSIVIIAFFICVNINAQNVPQPATQESPKRAPIRYDAVLATVNGEPITRFELLLESGTDEVALRKMAKEAERDLLIQEHRKTMLQNLIDRKLVLREYAKYNHPIPNQMVEDAIDRIAANIGDGSRDTLKKKLKQMDISEAELYKQAKNRIAAEMMVYEYCHRRVQATPKQCYDYYTAHQADFEISPQWELQILHILPPSQNPQSDSIVNFIATELSANPQQFNMLLEKYGEGFSSKQNQTSTFENKGLREDFQNALNVLPPQAKVTPPVYIPEGVIFLKVIARGEPRQKSFDEVREEIKELLERPIRKQRTNEFFARLRKNAIIHDFTRQN